MNQGFGFQTGIFIATQFSLSFVYYFVKISDQGCFGVYSQSNLHDRMLRLHSYQYYPQNYCTNIQNKPHDVMVPVVEMIGLI